jgi:hypothetical protein
VPPAIKGFKVSGHRAIDSRYVGALTVPARKINEGDRLTLEVDVEATWEEGTKVTFRIDG